MMKFYAYKPNTNGNEPMGTANRLLYELKTVQGGVRRAIRILGISARVYLYTNLYDETTYRQVY